MITFIQSVLEFALGAILHISLRVPSRQLWVESQKYHPIRKSKGVTTKDQKILLSPTQRKGHKNHPKRNKQHESQKPFPSAQHN